MHYTQFAALVLDFLLFHSAVQSSQLGARHAVIELVIYF